MENQHHNSDSIKLYRLAHAWWELVNSNCPKQWCKLLPDLNLDESDRIIEPQSLPVQQYLHQLTSLAPLVYRPVLNALIDAQSSLYFGQTYAESDFGADFLRQYGWVKLLGPDAYWHSDKISSGFLILGDNNTYPQHWHEAEEIYLPISGNAEWYREGEDWQIQPPGKLIHHASGIKHGTRTTGEAMIALYLWRGGNLTQKSKIQ